MKKIDYYLLILLLGFLIGVGSIVAYANFYSLPFSGNDQHSPHLPGIVLLISFNFLFTLPFFLNPKQTKIDLKKIIATFLICYFFAIINVYTPVTYLLNHIYAPEEAKKIQFWIEGYVRALYQILIIGYTGYIAHYKYKKNHLFRMLFLGQCVVYLTGANMHWILVQKDMVEKQRATEVEYMKNLSTMPYPIQWKVCNEKRYICIYNWDEKTYTHYHYEYVPKIQEMIKNPKSGVFEIAHHQPAAAFFGNHVLFIDIHNVFDRDNYYTKTITVVLFAVAAPAFCFWDMAILVLIYFHWHKRQEKIKC